jgi:serine/threonine protein kinase
MQPQTFGKTPGESFGDRYQIEQQLGKRAGRYTLLARDLQTQALVVIKRLSFGEDFVWEDLKLFEREAATLKNLSHASIPRYLDYFDLDLPSGKGFALVQTYIPAKSLDEHVKAGRTFSEAEMVELATALLEILRYLHERAPSVIHRDIKPSNILLGDRTGNSIGSVYLVDFGSVQAAPAGGTITVVGTYGYMPPEQFGDRAVPASDLYSLGATLIYLATGQHPADLPQIEQRLEFETLASLSPGVAKWLRRMIHPSLSQRFTSAQQALNALQGRDTNLGVVVYQPAHSRVMLTKTADTLEIVFPPATSPLVGVLNLLVMAIYSIGLSYIGVRTLLHEPFPRNLLAIAPLLWFGYAVIGRSGGALFDLWGQVRLTINERQIRQDFELFGFKRSTPPPSLRQDISNLDLTKECFKRELDGRRTEVKPQLLIWAGARKYGFDSGTLSQPELNWLAQELSFWLNLPIENG